MSRRAKIFTIVGIVLGAAILIPVIRHYQLRFAVDAYVAQLKAKGEPMDLAQVIPPPVPPEQNSAAIFLKAASLLDTNWNILGSNPPPVMQMVAPGKAMIGWRQPDIRCEVATNSWAEIKESLGQDREALNLLTQITNSSLFDFNLAYTKSFDEMQFTHLVREKKAAQRLCSSAICDLNSGNTIAAEKNIRAALALVNGTHEERTAISQLVRIVVAQIGTAATWELLQSPNLTDEQLSDLQTDWLRLEFVQAMEHALWVEREGDETTLEKWRSSNSGLQHYFDLTKQAHEAMGNINEEDSLLSRTKFKTKVFLWQYWWSYPDELRCLKGYEVLIEKLRQADTNGFFIGSSGMFWEFFIGRDKGLIPRSGKRYRF
jgi:hypothetical protein